MNLSKVAFLPVAVLIASAAANAETIELVTYYPSVAGGDIESDRIHASRATIGDDPYSLTNPPDADLPDGTLLVAGALGIGADDPSTTLDIAGGVRLRQTVGGVRTPNAGYVAFTDMTLSGSGLVWNAYFVDTPQWRYQDDGFSMAINGGNLGEIAFFTASSGNEGDTVTYMERMQISNNGNVGIGTTDPASARLVVNGAVGDTDWIGANNVADFASGQLNSAIRVTNSNGISSSFGTDTQGDAYIGTVAANKSLRLIAGNGNSEMMRVAPNGVSINSSAPEYTLHVDGSIGGAIPVIQMEDSPTPIIRMKDSVGVPNSRAFQMQVNSTGFGLGAALDDWNWAGGGVVRSFFLKHNGNFGIGTADPAYKLDVAGQAHATGFPTSSDARLKANVVPLAGVLEKLEKVRPVAFDWNGKYEQLGRSSGHREIGVVAQDVEAVFPELVTTWGEENYRAVDYGRFTAVLVQAVKELNGKVQRLEEANRRLEKALKEASAERRD